MLNRLIYYWVGNNGYIFGKEMPTMMTEDHSLSQKIPSLATVGARVGRGINSLTFAAGERQIGRSVRLL